MELKIDTHTHSLLSGHAYSTVFENVAVAKHKGLQGLVITEHSGKMPGIFYPQAVTFLRQMPQSYNGIRIFKGVESNIINFAGEIDVQERFLVTLDFVIASLHEVLMPIGNKMQNTDAMLGALNNKYVDILGHPGNPVFDVDREAVVKEAKRLGKMLEFNGHSFEARPGSETNCKEMLQLCKKHEVQICVGSDAHICFNVGDFENAYNSITEVDFPHALIVSRNLKSFEAYLAKRAQRLENAAPAL